MDGKNILLLESKISMLGWLQHPRPLLVEVMERLPSSLESSPDDWSE